MTRCPSCDREIPDGAAACPACGSEPAEVFRCRRCESEYEEADACPVCGALREPVPCAEHPDRPAHSRCVICGRAVCSRDVPEGREPALCADHGSVPVIEGWAQVYSTTTEMEARLLRDNLLSEGIDAQVFSQNDRSFPVEMGELSIVRLLVPVWEYEAALANIREHMDAEGEVVFACPSCGEAYEPGSAECASCGAALAV
jgi:predicted RNA-binding Zn-ribbon protein involved in translation (DUF1610 family)